MSKQTQYFLFYLFLLLLSCYLFLSGVINLNNTFLGLPVPVGGFLAWSILIFIPIVIFYGNKSLYQPSKKFHLFYRRIIFLILCFAVLWLFIGYVFAGNWRFNFKAQEAFRGSESASMYFLYFTLTLVIVPVLIGIALRIHNVVAGILSRKS
ncbi:hypothetical protein [Joostella sp. CR20]|uniref:hypothetical protein n=1 Tax=Joostella sp. CR20 TaxID=2804312 RepID=UPI00313EB8A1